MEDELGVRRSRVGWEGEGKDEKKREIRKREKRGERRAS